MKIGYNSIYGLIGFAIPTVVMLVAYPVLINHLGAEVFGIYILATSVSGSLAFFDFGVSSAAVKFIAEDMVKGNQRAAAEVINTSLIFYGGLGAIGDLLIWFLSPRLVLLFRVDPLVQTEAIWAFRLAALQFGIYLLTVVFVSVFKGMQRFDYSALVLSFLSVLTYAGAVAGVLLFGAGLQGITTISFVANLVIFLFSAILSFMLCRTHSIQLISTRPSFYTFRRMFNFGIAMTVHMFASFFFRQAQRLLVGALIGPGAVTIYVLAVTVVSKVHELISATTEIIFPIASVVDKKNKSLFRRVYLHMLFGSGIIAILILLPLVILAEPILKLWVGADLASKTAPLMMFFAIAFFFVSLSPVPFYVVNGFGKPWFNVIFDLINVTIATLLIVVFAVNGLTLVEFAWAFAISNAVNGLLYQVAVEILIWRSSVMSKISYES